MFSANAKKDLRSGSGEVLVFQACAPLEPPSQRSASVSFTVISAM